MGSRKVYMYGPAELTETANQVKEILLETLEREGLLAEGTDAQTIAATYAVICYTPGWFGKVWEKVRGTTSDTWRFAILKTTESVKASDDDE